ncbi:MAG: transporter, partial [Verrucomicrobiota bacterium]
TEQVRGGPKGTVRGIGDTVLRGKMNFWGNDGGATGFGLIADVKLPTAANGIGNDHTELALTFPVSFELGAGWDGAAMTTLERAFTDAGKFEAVWTNTFSVAREVAKETGAFFELVSTTGAGRHVLLFDVGLTHRIGSDFQIDAGVNIGVSHTAPDLGVFAGFSRRF